MMLEITIGETICVEYLVRMRRQAVQCYTDLPASSLVQPGEGDEAS